MDPLYWVQGNLAKFPCTQYKGKRFLNFDTVPVKVHLNKLDFCNLLIKIFDLIPKFLVDFHRKIFTKWAPHCALGKLVSSVCSSTLNSNYKEVIPKFKEDYSEWSVKLCRHGNHWHGHWYVDKTFQVISEQSLTSLFQMKCTSCKTTLRMNWTWQVKAWEKWMMV